MNTGNNTNNLSEQSPEKRDDQIYYMLKAIEARIAENKDSLDLSKKLFPLGIDTDLINTIKKTIEDPVSQLLIMKDDVNNTVGSVIKLIFTRSFEANKDKIKTAYLIDSGKSGELHFYIVLHSDDFESRNDVFGLLREYKTSKFWESFPVYFQFVPQELAGKLTPKETLLESA